MRELLKLSKIRYEVMDNVILEDVTASVQEKEIIAIIGKNGAGKSTLLQLINQEIKPSEGKIQMLQDDSQLFMVEQETEVYFSEQPTSRELELMKKWKVPTHEYSQLSGGEKLKARLAQGFSKKVDLLMLDEPTNHLDVESLQLLEDEIKQFPGTIIFVSHDRYFINRVATKIWSIESKKLIQHKGNYTSYMDHRKLKRLTQQREYEKQQRMVEQIEGQIKELSEWSHKAHAQSTKKEGFKEYHRVKAKRTDAQIKSKQKRLEKELEKAKIERVKDDYTVRFAITTHNKVGKRLLEVKNLNKSFDERTLFENVNFTIQHGEKLAIIGPNGSGKTTLLKILLQQEKAEGEVWISPSANIGYLTQEVFDIPLEKTPAQLFYQETFESRGKVQNLMKHLGFTVSQWNEPTLNMSMGERVKCKLMAYILEEKDVLILDEPTNHLDLPSREQLEETLSKYNGTLIVVSHDRYFLEKITEHKLVITKQQIKKQVEEKTVERDKKEEQRLTLETERQEILGKLSFIKPNDPAYAELDQKFNQLTKQINAL